MKKNLVKLNPQEAAGVTRRGRGTRAKERYVHYRDGEGHLVVDIARGRSVSVANGCGATSFYMHPATLDGKRCEISSAVIRYMPRLSPSRNDRHEAR